MGQILKGRCSVCEFETRFKYGGGKLNHKTVCMVPAIDNLNREFFNVNYYEHQNTGDFTFYHDEKLKGNDKGMGQLSYSGLKLNAAHNYCPKCESFDFNFGIEMFYD